MRKREVFGLSASLILALGVLLIVFLFAGTPTTTAAAPLTLTSIYDIQYTTNPSGDSPLVGQVVTTTGIVYAVYSGRGFCIADAAGPWHGIYVYYPSGTMPQIGDEVQVQGTVQEYYSLTELANYASYNILSSGNPVYAPSVVTAAQIEYNDSASEPYESVFVEVHDIEVTAGADTYGVWTFTDTSGGTAKADDWGYHLEPDVGDEYAILRGALIYWYDYVVMPRDADDVVEGPHLAVLKEAPPNVAPGTLLTYTIAVVNNTGISLTQVIITDVIPTANATFAYALDGGVLVDSDVISWTAASLASGDGLSLRFAVTATGSVGDEIWNNAYTGWATNWPTPTVGGPLLTIIGDYTPIYQIQGNGFASPYKGWKVKTVGVVVGFFEGNYSDGGDFDGFFIQDPTGDGITLTADGLFVNHGVLPVTVNVGDIVTVTGVVQEFSEWDEASCPGNECLTQIAVSSAGDVTVGGAGTIASIVLDPPGDPSAAATYWESLEGMLVTLPSTATVVGPTSYGTIMAVSGSLGIDRVMRTGPYAGMPVGVRHWKKYGALDDNSDPPNLIVGSVVDNMDGPLAFSYDNYIVTTQAGDAWTAVYNQPAPEPPPSWPPASENEFTVLSFNVENFFDSIDDPGKDDPIVSSADYATHRDKIAGTIVQAGCPVVVGVQEVEKLAVLQDVAGVMATRGCTYTAVLSEGLDGRGIDVGYLVRDDRVTIDGVWQHQDCTTYDTGLGQGNCPAGQQRLFSRIPLVMTATVQFGSQPTRTARVIFIVNHLKSKLSRSGDPESAQWRLLQAQSLAQLVDQIISSDPNARLVVLGDLNDFEDSLPLETLYAGGNLTNTWYTLPAEDRYSYIYQGVSQVLDHILVSPAVWAWTESMSPLHYNADFPHEPYADDDTVVWRTSDHDPVAATFAAQPALTITKSVTLSHDPALPNDPITYTIVVYNTGLANAVGVHITDTLPNGVIGTNVDVTQTVAANDAVIITVPATVANDAPWGAIIVNTAYYEHSTGTGSADAVFRMKDMYFLYLPLVTKDW